MNCFQVLLSISTCAATTREHGASARLAEELTRAERRLEHAVSTTAAALDAAERAATEAGDRAAAESRQLAAQLQAGWCRLKLVDTSVASALY